MVRHVSQYIHPYNLSAPLAILTLTGFRKFIDRDAQRRAVNSTARTETTQNWHAQALAVSA